MRRQSKRPDVEAAAERQSGPPPTDETVLNQKLLSQALDRLSPGYRTVLVLHDVEGLTHDEIAKRMGVAVGTSKSQLHKARARMRDLLSPARAKNEAGNHV
ncbi:MAG: sigma-70 family RNA polymerase sigma factor [Gemmatimonadetes bacterium]|nr:sigma-70 family RNA polymerase sigma factor [Gemmatimonadota bacterium]